MSPTLHQHIAEHAYYIWLNDGMPHGFADHHWFAAEIAVAATSTATDVPMVAKAKPAKRSAAKATAVNGAAKATTGKTGIAKASTTKGSAAKARTARAAEVAAAATLSSAALSGKVRPASVPLHS